ncbi:MAG TPA: AAA family ATPase [Methanobacterium sp.]|nr:AAA family ATPase [Methanobacterium sp.]
MKIGILYVKGALPLFEDFGNLPTHTVNQYGLVNGVKAHKVLDGLILPGGSMVESITINPELKREVEKMALNGSFILGMCSGFQLLAQTTNIGRKSPCPIIKEGMGLLDVTFSPLISNDRVEAEIVDQSFLTRDMVGSKVRGFHCHTYGDIKGNAPSICYSQVQRMNYQDNSQKVLSGVRNDDGNVVGIMLHASLDENPQLVHNILEYMDATEEDIQEIKRQNKELKGKIRMELGVETNIFAVKGAQKEINYNPEYPPMIMMGSTGSDSGKTFLTAGIVGVLRKKGYKIGVLKVGPDIRDIVPSLYLNKEKMEKFSSIKIGHLGWKDLQSVLEDLKNKRYDLVIVEGVMSIFTGLLNEKIPYSSVEVAKAGNIPVILISPCNKGGIETAAIDLVSHVQMLSKLGVTVNGVILNKVYDEEIGKSALEYIKTNIDVEFSGLVPKIKLKERGNIPEVELKLEEFCLHAMNTIETHIDPEKILSLAQKPEFRGYMSYQDILENFK